MTNNENQINNLLLKKYTIKVDLEDYQNKKCPSDTLTIEDYLEYNFKGVKDLGDLDNDGINDKLFILHPLNRCEEGQSYYFSNKKIPRIQTESNCCHLSSIINIGDINEDGKAEIAEYFSSCASRYKSITVYSLKENYEWSEIISFSFVLNDSIYIEKDFDKLFKKVSKGQLEYYEIEDLNIEGKIMAAWKKIEIK